MKVCVGCVYCNECGNTNRTEPCAGRETRTEQKKIADNLLADLKGTFTDGFAYVSEMNEKGFTDEAILLLKKYELIQACDMDHGDVAYTW